MKILAFAGSLRKGSFNKSLLRAAKEVSPEEMTIEIFDLEGIPLFNADVGFCCCLKYLFLQLKCSFFWIRHPMPGSI